MAERVKVAQSTMAEPSSQGAGIFISIVLHSPTRQSFGRQITMWNQAIERYPDLDGSYRRIVLILHQWRIEDLVFVGISKAKAPTRSRATQLIL